jgi:hypothetical protein
LGSSLTTGSTPHSWPANSVVEHQRGESDLGELKLDLLTHGGFSFPHAAPQSVPKVGAVNTHSQRGARAR